MPTKVAVHGQLSVYINLRIQAPIKGKGIDFNALDILSINISCIVGLSSLAWVTYCHFMNYPSPWLSYDWFLAYQVEFLYSYNLNQLGL